MPPWMLAHAQQIMGEAQQLDPEQGLQRLVAGLLMHVKDMPQGCRGGAACFLHHCTCGAVDTTEETS